MRVGFNYYIALLLILFTTGVYSQDLPLFNQKLTNSFTYNPSVAGNGMGSITLSHRSFWNGVPGAPKTNLFSGHLPFGQNRFGAGINIIKEHIGASENLYLNGAFAYHLSLTDEITWSLGVSTEYTNLTYNTQRFDARDESDILLTNPDSRNSLDFSFGTSIRHPFFEVGFSSNRLATALALTEFKTQISQFYTAYGQVTLPLTERHKLEPTFVYRKLSTESSQWEAGVYYSFRDALILGGSYRSGGIISPTAAFRFNNRLLVGYTFEMFGSGIQKEIGSTSEISLRLDFMQESFYKDSRNSTNVMRQSMAFKRKTLSSGGLRGKPLSASNPKYKKKIKRNYTKSPSYKINNSKKLNTKKFGSNKKSFTKSKNINKKSKKTSFKKYKKRNKGIR